MPVGHHMAFHLWGLDGNSGWGPGTSGDFCHCSSSQESSDTVPEYIREWAEQVVWDQ